MACPDLLLIKIYIHRRHLFCHTYTLDLKMENNKGKAVMGEISVFIFSVTVFDFEKPLNRCQAPMFLPQWDLGSRYFPCEVVEFWKSRHGRSLTFYYDREASLWGNKHSNVVFLGFVPTFFVKRNYCRQFIDHLASQYHVFWFSLLLFSPLTHICHHQLLS